MSASTRPGGSARASSTASRCVVAIPVTVWPAASSVWLMSSAITGSSSMISTRVGGCSRRSRLPAASSARTSSSLEPMMVATCAGANPSRVERIRICRRVSPSRAIPWATIAAFSIVRLSSAGAGGARSAQISLKAR